ncbi:MAG TPA: acetylxylan esterase [Pirellulales bacterium]|jgi:dienelactone hydrolase|nr:acetylxylan esterase [Pirellulales bacterium]
MVAATRLITLSFAISSAAVALAAPRALSEGQKPDDRRLGALKDLNGYFPFEPPKTVEAWKRRATELRRQLLVSQGLWPMPTKTPAEAVVHGRIDRGDYTVERVSLQSYPGHYISGNLYRPVGRSGKLPGVLCPHGHWPNGRFYDVGEKKIRQEIVAGAERFEDGGRSPLQSRCMQLARMGCVVFHYDMVGYADSQQIAHRPGVREAMNTAENWGFFSPQAELRLQNMMGLQTYNSIRALDWLCELPDVDPQRIAVTGASGGGTQTFVLCGCDDRPAVQWPAVMVSTAMQGGCTCENACYLRLNTGNVELAAIPAPKPLGMSAADDWTKEIMTKGYPELQELYKLLGAKDRVLARPFMQFPHNYNYVSRAAMSSWFNKHLKLGLDEPIAEEDYRRLSEAEMTVWDEKHPKPPSGDDYERSLLRTMTEMSDKQIAAITPTSAESFDQFTETVGGAWEVFIGRKFPEPGAIEHEKIDEQDRGTYLEFTSLLKYPRYGEVLPTVFLLPKKWEQQVVVWAHGDGKQGLYKADGSLHGAVEDLLEAGFAVVSADVFGTGEFTDDCRPATTQRLVQGPKIGAAAKYAGYTFGYNHSLFAQRVHDLLSVISYVRNHEKEPKQVFLVGLAGAGPWAAAARAIAGSAVDRAAIDTQGFRFADCKQFADANFVPGSVKYGDLPALLALSAPYELWIAGEGSSGPALVRGTYRALDHGSSFQVYDGPSDSVADAALDWLFRE